jgi:EAL domain-containing protein (putative c-di-GMP-specific phosphodiesterase class I)/GGDEF domain-containing protein
VVNSSENSSIFYIHDLATGQINWFGSTKIFLGVEADKVNTREKFLQLLHEKDRRSYEFNMNNLVEEISCEYTILNSGKHINIKEIAVKTNRNSRPFLQGIITFNDYGITRIGEGKYNIAGRSILTGKFDSGFLDSLKNYYNLGNKNKHSYILLLVSIDNIPMISNWQGIEVANSIIQDVKNKISDILYPESTIHNVNSDQLGIIAKNPTANEVEFLVNKIGKLISLYKHPRLEDAFNLRISIGSVHFPLGVKDEVDIINKAYLALTNAKSKQYEFYCDFEEAKRDHIDAQNEMAQLHYLQEAFNDNRIVLAYQPVVSAIDGSVESYECLLRINNGSGRFESAGRLIGVAEKMGTIETIDEYVLKTAIEELSKNKKARLSVNVSNVTTSSDMWLKMCSESLSDEEVASRITFEITETAAQKDLRKTAYFTAAIQSLGAKVSLDDFGVGFTSFRQLRSLSIDSLKIDGSFVLGLEENKENLIFVRSLVDFGKSYGLKTIAECVENGEVAKKLIDLGVDYMQGYYFGAPEVSKPWDGKK